MRLNEKVALITGGANGIGLATTERFAKEGAKIILWDVSEKGNDVTEGLKKKGTEAIFKKVSVSNQDEVQKAVAEAKKHFGRIDILINNAGINKINLNVDTATEDYDLLNNVNLKGPYLLCREVSKLMIKNKYGRIVNITSIWSAVTRSGRSLYTATKWAIAGLTKTLAVELAPYEILVNSVGPGFTLTELTASTNTPEEIEKMAAIIPMKRFAQPVEIANLILFLSSSLNTYLTAQNLIIDGGYTNV